MYITMFFFSVDPPHVLAGRKTPVYFTMEGVVSVSQVDEIMIIRASYVTKQV